MDCRPNTAFWVIVMLIFLSTFSHSHEQQIEKLTDRVEQLEESSR